MRRGTHARAGVREGDRIRSLLEPIGTSETIAAFMKRNAARHGARPAIRVRRGGAFRNVTWRELVDDVVAFGRYLDQLGVTSGDRVVVVSPNRGEMLVAELATMCLGAIYTPLFAGYSPDQTSDLLAHAAPAAVVLPDAEWRARLRVPLSARAVITFAEFRNVLAPFRSSPGDPRRHAFLERGVALDPTAPCLMMYTSGTSGALKGVQLTHDNILSQRRALAAIWDIGPEDRFLSYLPWHHSFGGIFEKYSALYNGAPLAIDDSYGRDFDVLLRNWMEIRPTIYFSVPKVYQQLVAHIQSHPEDEARIFHPELRFVFTAAAPLPTNLSEFFAARHIPVAEGWGLTETSPCCTLTDLNEPRTEPGKVGYPLPGVTVKIADDGEILVKGPHVMRGYYRDDEATAKALPGDGWFHTGDLGELLGPALKLVARKDRVFKMLNAEKVVPTEIENRLAGMNPYIRHVIVAGGGRDFLCALIYPDFFRIGEEFGHDHATADRVVAASLRETIAEFNRTHAIKYEHIKAVAVISKELTIEDQELTPSLKVRVRNVLAEAEDYLEAVYQPSAECDCRFLRKVLRVAGDDRPCFGGRPKTLDRCHECGSLMFGETQ
ncbi:MAG: AMP-binding protein [Gemmatimonadaceae bacterium]|nr:AMP-binding protein [Gemmatimonadaceae bacterium]